MVRWVARRTSRSASVSGPDRKVAPSAPGALGTRREGAPEPVEETPAAVDHLLGLLGPVHVVERRPDEEVEEPQPVGPDRLVVVLGRDQVALRLGHLGAVHADHALGQVPLERLAGYAGGETHIDEGAGEEAGVEEVQDGVLDAPDVLVDRHPVPDRLGIEGPVGAPGIAEAQEVPGGVDEGVHGVGLAAGRPPIDGAGGVEEPLVEGQR